MPSELEKFKLAFTISLVPALLVSKEGDIILSTAMADELFGYDEGGLVGVKIEKLVPDKVRPHHPELVNAYFRYPSKRKLGNDRELAAVTQFGEVIPVEVSLDTVTIDGKICALAAIFDIRYRKQYEDRVNMAMDAAASAMIMVDEQGNIVFTNRAAVSLFGYEEAELLHMPIEQLVPREIKHAHTVYRRSFMEAQTARSMGKDTELFALHRDGFSIPVEIALTPVQTPNGRMVMSTIIDRTEHVAAERVLAEKSRLIQQTNDELTQFAYSASHDLKAPLVSITGLIDICLEDLEEGELDEVKENLLRCQQISQRSATKIEGIMAIARVGQDRVEPEAANLKTIVEEIWLDMTGANKANVKLKLELEHEDPIVVEIFAVKVILENLLSNALHYRDLKKAEHFITVKTELNGNNILIHVIDNGVGISEENQQVVFDLFKRLDDRSGDGLGLALVKKQVERLGGVLTLDSTLGEGTTFSVAFPLHFIET